MEKFDLQTQATELESRLQSIRDKKDIDQMIEKAAELDIESQKPDFWNDAEYAQKAMKKIGNLRKEIETVQSLEKQIKSNSETLAEVSDADNELLELIAAEFTQIDSDLQKIELTTFLSGKFDSGDAIFSINAGAGGTEAMDWTEMLMRMYVRYFNSLGWDVTISEKVDGPEAGISSVSMEVHGEYAYGYLKHEHGTHRLVRISPFNAAGQRQTSFAGVDVSPLTDQDVDIDIPDTDIDFQAVRSGGPGGQSVNKTSSAVRIRHLPTGILIAYSGARNQLQNREEAMRMLKAKLYLLEEAKRKADEAGEKGEYKQASWGNQIRNYVLQPYKLVKDTRTGVEVGNADAVLDGDIQVFIDAAVRQL